MIKTKIIITIILLVYRLLSFSQSDSLKIYYIISEIKIEGNNKTKDFVILRDLSFKKGDTLKMPEINDRIIQSKTNLQKMPLFNFVDFALKNIEGNRVEITINLAERWYLWPELAFYYADRNFSNWLKECNFNHLDYGGGAVKYNFRGRNEKIEFYKIFGYNRLLIFNYENMFLDKKRQNSISFSFKQLNRKETSYIVENDKIRWLGLENEFVLTKYNGFAEYTYRKKIFTTHTVILGFDFRKAADTLLQINPKYFPASHTSVNYFYLKYIFSFDNCDSRIYPLSGVETAFSINKSGLNILPESGVNNISLTYGFSKFYRLFPKFYFSNNIVLRKTIGNNDAFFLDNALGYTYNIRGFEYNVIKGSDFILQKNTFNFEFLPKKEFNIKFIPYKSISRTHLTGYISLFSDFAYVVNADETYNSINTLANKFLFSYGMGINFLSYYDKLLRIEYSRTNNGNSGFFIHFESPF